MPEGRAKHSSAKCKDQYIQVLRGFAISAVVLIHCLPLDYEWVIFVRPFLNFGVPMFLFLSGYLTPESRCANVGAFYKRRIGKILIPYFVWSFIYILIAKQSNPLQIIKDLCFGSAAAQMYYLLVYAQLVLLTPLLYWMIKRAWGTIICWALTPVVLIIREYGAYAGFSTAFLRVFFGSWLIYYLLGMCWKSLTTHLLKWKTIWSYAIILTLTTGIQIFAAYIWYRQSNFDLATTQLKISSMLTALSVIGIAMTAPKSFRLKLVTKRLLTLTGDCSYGVYLSHLVIVDAITTVLHRLNGEQCMTYFISSSQSGLLCFVSQFFLLEHANWFYRQSYNTS